LLFEGLVTIRQLAPYGVGKNNIAYLSAIKNYLQRLDNFTNGTSAINHVIVTRVLSNLNRELYKSPIDNSHLYYLTTQLDFQLTLDKQYNRNAEIYKSGVAFINATNDAYQRDKDAVYQFTKTLQVAKKFTSKKNFSAIHNQHNELDNLSNDKNLSKKLNIFVALAVSTTLTGTLCMINPALGIAAAIISISYFAWKTYQLNCQEKSINNVAEHLNTFSLNRSSVGNNGYLNRRDLSNRNMYRQRCS